MKSLRGQFVDWARTKGDEPYNYYSTKNGSCGCGLTQFLSERGVKVGESPWCNSHRQFATQLSTRPWTFSALASRLEAMK